VRSIVIVSLRSGTLVISETMDKLEIPQGQENVVMHRRNAGSHVDRSRARLFTTATCGLSTPPFEREIYKSFHLNVRSLATAGKLPHNLHREG